MEIHSNRYRITLLLLVWWILLICVADSYPDGLSFVHRADDHEQSAIPKGVKDEGFPSILQPRMEPNLLNAGEILDKYNAVPDDHQVDANEFRAFDLLKRRSDTFHATECWGCVVVVIASGKKLLIAHFAETVDKEFTFAGNDEALLEYAVNPIIRLIAENKEELGPVPSITTFAPRSSDDSTRYNNQNKVNDLIQIIKAQFQNTGQVSNRIETYRNKKYPTGNADLQGKLTVLWTSSKIPLYPYAYLDIYTEDRRALASRYACYHDMKCDRERTPDP